MVFHFRFTGSIGVQTRCAKRNLNIKVEALSGNTNIDLQKHRPGNLNLVWWQYRNIDAANVLKERL